MNKYPKINYIGNKEKISKWIVDLFPSECSSVVDLFSGGCSVSYELKKRGYEVLSNDALYSNFCLAKAIIENSSETINFNDYKKRRIKEESIVNHSIEISFLANKIYYQYEINELSKLMLISRRITGYKKFLYLSALRRAMIRKIPYSRMNVEWKEIVKLRDEDYSYKKYGRYRSYHNKSFEFHIDDFLSSINNSVFENGKNNKAYQKDAIEFCRSLNRKVDIVYIDPPYPSTMNNYNSFYGYFDDIFHKRLLKITDFTSKINFLKNLSKIINCLKDKTKYIAISLNNKAKPSSNEIINLLRSFSNKISVYEKNHPYKVTNRENKQLNYELLILSELKNN